MIPFRNTWPYETVKNDVYVSQCPYCSAENVLIPLRKQELHFIHEGRKKLLVFPCCNNKTTLIDVDLDYLLADQPLRKK
jgi:hypothetical protein